MKVKGRERAEEGGRRGERERTNGEELDLLVRLDVLPRSGVSLSVPDNYTEGKEKYTEVGGREGEGKR